MNMELRMKCTGLGLIGWIVSIPVLLISLVVMAFIFCEANKTYWDHKVTEMCEKDGGIKIYETVELEDDEYQLYIDDLGNFNIPREDKASMNLKIVSKYLSQYIHRNKPEVRRFELQVLRRADNKLLGTMISYGRVGGDLIALHPSIFSCPEKSVNLFTTVVSVARNKEKLL